MAQSGIIKTNTTYDSYFFVKWSQEAQYPATNKTRISYSCGVYCGHHFYSNAITMSSVTINGTQVYGGGTYSDYDVGEHIVKSGTMDITHNADGTKKFKVGAFTGWLYSNNNYSAAEKEFVLDSIPRLSNLSVPVFEFGVAGTIGIEKASSKYTHTIKWYFGSSNGTIATKTSAISVKWTPALSLLTQMVDKTKGTGYLRVTTYNGDVSLGSYDADFTINAGADIKPTCTFSMTDTKGYLSSIGACVQGKSKLVCDIAGTPAYGSPIVSYSVSVNGVKTTSASNPVTTSEVTGIGEKSVSVSVKDGRGRKSASVKQTITILPYAKPSVIPLSGLSDIVCVRCDSDGTVNPSGTHLKVRCGRKYSSLTFNGTAHNKCLLRVRTKETDGGTYTAWTTLLSKTATGSTFDGVVGGISLQADKMYTIQVQAIDDVGDKNTVTVSVAAQGVTLHLGEGGKNIGIGRYANMDSSERVDVAWDTHFERGISIGGKPVGTYESVTITSADERVTVYNSNVRYFRFMNLCFCRITLLTTGALPAGAVYTVANIGAHAPTSYYALAAYGTKNFSASTTTDGKIRVRTYEDIPTNYYLYISGYWFAS